MRNTNTTLVYKWFQEVWNNGRRETIDELLSDHVIAHGLGPDRCLKGVEPFKKFYDEFRQQVGNVQVVVEDVISEEGMECALCKVTGVFTATKKNVEFSGLCMAKIENGKITEVWNHYDFLKMYQQAGYALTRV